MDIQHNTRICTQSVRIVSLGRKRMTSPVAFRTECILWADNRSTERRIPDGMQTAGVMSNVHIQKRIINEQSAQYPNAAIRMPRLDRRRRVQKLDKLYFQKNFYLHLN
jgi:hypothetical protein